MQSHGVARAGAPNLMTAAAAFTHNAAAAGVIRMNRKARRAARSNGHPAIQSAPMIAAAAHFNDGNMKYQAGALDEAMQCYLRAIEARPDFMDAHLNFCAVLIAQSRHAEAAAHCEGILAHDPKLLAAHIHLGVARIGMGDGPGALSAARRALALSETRETRTLFAHCLQLLPALPETDPQMREPVRRAIAEAWGRPGELARHAAALVKADPAIGGCVARAVAAFPRPLTGPALFGAEGLAAIVGDRLLHALMHYTRIADIAMERFLTAARHVLLDVAVDGADAQDQTLEFRCALARHCFFNEFVFAQTNDEVRRLDALQQALAAALDRGAEVSAAALAAFASYRPLSHIAGYERLLARRWPDAFDAVLTQQLREPAEEARLRADIPALTPVENDVSRLVQRQYEENPYPRWVNAAPAGKPSDVNTCLRGQFPHSAFRDLSAAADCEVLVAGCGTGQQLVDTATRFTGARILAIDLSLPSLAYARRQIAAMRLHNVDFAQADILELGKLGRKFHVIDCGGVLHHLADPVVGWNVLLSLLRPDGVMRIALYSEIARRHVVAARRFVTERGFGDSPDDIRRFRQAVLALPEDDIVRRVAATADFFSISECRDLVFHVQEHRFTLPQIAVLVASGKMNFLGFDIAQPVLNRYRARFPEDRAATDLGCWHRFELDHPDTFGGMYQFWMQARRP